MPKGKPVPTSLDLDKLKGFTSPLTMRLNRERPGDAPEFIPLPNNGQDFTIEQVRGLELGLAGEAGGGTFIAQCQDSKGETLQWRFHVPGRPVVPAGVQADLARAQQNSQQAAQGTPAWQQTTAQGQVQNPWAQQQQQQHNPPQMPPQQGWNPYGQPQPGQQVPYGQPPYGGQLGGAPYAQPYGMPPYGPPPYGPPAFGPSYGYAPPPPPAAPVNAAIEQKLAALEQQNSQLREDRIRREQSEHMALLASELKNLSTATNTRFEQLLASLAQQQKPSSIDSDLKMELQKQEQERKNDQIRMENQRALEQRDLQVRLDKMDVENRRREEQIQREIVESRSNASSNQTLMLFEKMSQSQLAQATEAARAQKDAIGMLGPHLLTPEKLLNVIRESNPNKDGVTEKLANVAIQMMTEGGGGGWPQAATQISGALLDSAAKITGSVFEGKQAEAKMKMMVEARAQQQLAAVAQRGQAAPASRQIPAQASSNTQLGGASNGTPPAQPTQTQTHPNENTTAQEVLEAEERSYFGAAYESVIKLRQAYEAGAFKISGDEAGGIIETIASAYVYFVIGMGFDAPFVKDLEDNIEKVVRQVLPDAPGPLRHEIASRLPDRLEAADQLAEAQVQQAQAAQGMSAQASAQGAAPQEKSAAQESEQSATSGAPMSEAVGN